MLQGALSDVLLGLRKANVALYLAAEDMRSRYRRTALGPWWNVLSTVTFIGAMAVTFGALFRQPLEQFLPYLAASIGCWNFINGIVNDGPSTLVRGVGIINSYPLPLSTQIYRSVIDKTLLLFHFMLVYVGLLLVMQTEVDPMAMLLIPAALVVYWVAALGVSLHLGVLGARYRDLAPAVGSVMIMVFLITPIFWQKVGLSPESHWVVELNPFYHLIEVGRRPLLGQYASVDSWIFSVVIAVGLLLSGLVTYGVMRRKIYYWL